MDDIKKHLSSKTTAKKQLPPLVGQQHRRPSSTNKLPPISRRSSHTASDLFAASSHSKAHGSGAAGRRCSSSEQNNALNERLERQYSSAQPDHHEQRNVFQTSDQRSDDRELDKPIGHTQEEQEVQRLMSNGIRTWPILAVLSVFFCNPIAGMIASCLTLKAENDYYVGKYLQARNESRAAKVFIVLAMILGLATYVTLVIWIVRRCTGDKCL